jgi:hypothetical protein
MAAVADSNVVALELEKVLNKIRTVFEYDDKFYSNIEKKNVEVISNRQMRVPLELRPGGNFQYFNPDGGDLGRGGGPTWDKAILNCVFVSENIEYTKLTEWATNSDRKAITSAVRRMVARATDEIRRQLDGQAMQDGTGTVGTISAASTSGGVDTYTLNADGFGARLVRFGQVIQVFDSTLATLRGSGTITQWDVAGKTIQVTPAIAGATTNDLLVVNGISAPASVPALYGVNYQHSAASVGTWLGFSRANTPEIRSNRVNAASSALTLPFARLAINLMGNRVGIDNDFNPNAWMHPCQKQAYEEIGQLVSVIYKEPSDQKLNMYFDGMQLAGAPVRTSFNWNQKRIDFVDNDVWGRGEILPLGFYTTDGRHIFEIRGSSGGVATAEIFYMVTGFQFFVNNPAATAFIDTLAVPSGY